MKSKCSFILKASTSLVLALLMLFGTVATSFAAVVENAGFAAADEPEYTVEAEADDTAAPVIEVEPEAQEADPEPAVLTKDNTDLADTGAKVDLADEGWSTSDTWYVYNNVTTNGWSTGSPQMSSSDNNRYYVFYLKYGDLSSDSNQLRFRYYASGSNQTIGPGNGWWEQNATNNDNSNAGQVGPANNGNAYFYAPLTNNSVWQRVLVGANASGNYFWASVANLTTNLSATVKAAGSTSAQTINQGSSIALTGTASGTFSSSTYNNSNGAASGYKAVYTYQYSTNGTSWTDIGSKVTVTGSGAGTDNTGVSFTPPSYGTYYVRVIVNDGNVTAGTNAINDRYATSSNLTITVRQQRAITYNKGTAKSGGGTISGTTPSTQYYYNGGSAVTLAGNVFTSTGYAQDGWATSNGGSKAYAAGASYSTNAALSLYPAWTEKTSTLTVNTDGNGTLTKTGTTSGVASYVNVTAASGSSGYTFSRWNVSGTDAGHVVIKNSSGTTIYSNGSWTGTNYTTEAIRIYTDGSAASLSATVQAAFVSTTRTFYVGTMLKDDTGAYTTAKATNTANTGDGFTSVNTKIGTSTTSATVTIGDTAALSTHGDYSVTDTQNGVNLTYTKYKFMGWKSYSSAQTSIAASNTTWDSTSASYSPSVTASTNAYWYAVYRKYYVFSAYKSYDHAEGKLGNIIYKAAPPTRIKNGSAAEAAYTEASKIAVAAGDDIILTYASLSSSDCIDTVYYDNTTNYTTDTPTSANFVTEPPTLTEGTHYTVDNSTHKVTIHAIQNIKNITIATGTKYRAYLSDTDKIVVQSKNIDNFYVPTEDMSGSTTATYFTIKAKGSTDQTNTINTSNIKVYKADANGNPTGSAITGSGITFAYSSGTTAIANSDGTTSTRYIMINGKMPAYDVYIDLGVTVTYKMYLDSKMTADNVASKTKFNQVANIYMKNEAGSSNLRTQAYNSDTAAAMTSVYSLTSGTAVQYTYTFYGTDWPKYYMFIGWYTGTASGPDYDNGFVTDKQTFKYTPKKNTYMYAVGTRDLFINGSKYITGADNDWNRTGSNDPTNFRMSFDPSLGQNGKYYWTITDDIYKKANYELSMGATKVDGGHYYFSDDNTMGNSWFQFMDEPTGWNRGGVWYQGDNSGARLNDFITDTSGKIKYGRIRKSGDWTDQMGVIQFKDSTYPGYSSPITIYYEPGVDKVGTFTVEPSYIYPNIYLSNGYAVGSTTRNAGTTGSYLSTAVYMNGTTESTSTTYIATEGSGWTPDHEGHITHWKVKVKDATVRIKKSCATTEKVAAFFVYDLYDNKVYAESDVKSSGNTYYVDMKMKTGHDLYIVPILQVKTADMTVYFDGTQLDTSRWGKIVSCYAWYSSGEAQGAFPGQPMIPSDDGTSWTATFPSQLSDSNRLVGITFSNNIDGGHSWLGQSGVMPTVTSHTSGTIDTSTSILKHKYNDLGTDSSGNTQYRRLNCKVQTYDYREPISYYNNYKTYGDGDDITLTFAIKDGNSDSTMSLKHSELINTSYDLFTKGITHTHSDGTTTSNHKYTSDNFEYLTNATGKKYADLNGDELDGKPAPTFYVIAKGQVIYSNSTLGKVFWSGKNYTTASGVTYGVSGVSMNYGVQWYVYDASGNYITNMLSAGYADNVSAANTNSLIAKKLKDLGYAVDGKSVAISYDKPRYMYNDDNSVINSGSDFNSFRFTGQWYRTNNVQPVTVDVKVGMMTDSGEIMADTNSAGYGSATIMYDTTKGNASYVSSIVPASARTTGVASVSTALKDAENQPLKLTATEANFIGWYYYDNTGKLVQAKHTSNENFYPTYSKDITYYALYRAAATYKYKYAGREGDQYYSVSGGDLQVAELTDNKVRTTESIRQAGGKYDITALAPGSSKVSVFKKDIDFSKLTTYSNAEDYILDISKATGSLASYTLTYYCPNSKGGSIASHTVTKTYGSTVDLSSANAQAYAPTNQVFMGWYLYDTSKSGDARYTQLLTTQGNYGFVMVKNMTIAARYGASAASESGWKAFIDDSEVNKELNTSTTGRYYNDTVVRYRNGVNAAEALPNGAEVGVLIINNGGDSANTTTPTEAKLTIFANSLTGNGKTGKIGSNGITCTKLCKTVGTDVTPTYYNRVDFALRSDYASAKGSSYSAYAYVKIGSTYYWSAVATGDYAA